jgi:hypothetical protein
MSERIFLTYTNATAVPYQESVLGHHVVLNYIDSHGVIHTLQGTPEYKFEHNLGKAGAFLREEAFSDGKNNRDSPFGQLQAKGDRFYGAEPGGPHTLITEGDDLGTQWDRSAASGDDMDDWFVRWVKSYIR